MLQALEVADGLAAQQLCHGQVDQQLAAVIVRGELAAGSSPPTARHVSPVRSASSRSGSTPANPTQAVVIADEFQPVGP